MIITLCLCLYYSYRYRYRYRNRYTVDIDIFEAFQITNYTGYNWLPIRENFRAPEFLENLMRQPKGYVFP